MANNSIKHNFLWAFSERVSSKIVLFILQLFLARLLAPADYGLLAILLIFVNIATILVNSGLPSSLIQRKDIEPDDFSSVFNLTFTFSLIFYCIIYFSAPFISTFFDDDRISLMLRVISLTLMTGAYNSVQRAILSRELRFKELFKANLSGAIASAIISIIIAFAGFGVWAIIFQYIANQVVSSIVVLYYIRWIPKLRFNLVRVKSLWAFGWKYMLTSIISMISNDIYTAVIGKVFTKTQLGEYDTGNKIPQTISDTFSSSMSSVLFPSFSKIQEDKEQMKQYVRKINTLSSFIMFPLMFGLVAIATPLITIVLTDKWAGAIPYFQLACIMYAFYPLHIANIQAISARGYVHITLRNEILKKMVELLSLAILCQFGLYWVAFGRVASSIVALAINMYPNSRLLDYTIRQQIKDILPTLIIAIIASSVAYAVLLIPELNSCYIAVSLQIITGVVAYGLLSMLLNKKMVIQLVNQIRIRRV